MERKHKIIIIGSKGYELNTKSFLVDCYSWDEIQKIRNIRDYDTVIINLLIKPNEIDGDVITKHLNIESMIEIIQNDGEMIVVGDPRFEVEVTDQKSKEKKRIPFLWWTSIDFYWDDSPGDTVHFEDDYHHQKYANYISNLPKWDYSLSSCSLNKEQLMGYFNESFFEKGGLELNIEMDEFCYNRYRNPIAFSVLIGIFSKRNKQRPALFGSITFLPKINKNEDETIQMVLRDICGVEAELPEPEWLKDYIAPGQPEIDKKIEDLYSELYSTQKKLQQVEEEKKKIRTCLKLLYEREYALEPATREILRALGAHVEDPEERGKEDGWVVVNIGDKKYEGVLEIKSTKSDQFGEDGIRQLREWIQRGISLSQKKYKGIFIGNSAVDKPVEKRAWAFSNNWQSSAELNEICAIKTEHLFCIYVLKEEQALDVEEFWKMVFETNGVIDIEKFLQHHENED